MNIAKFIGLENANIEITESTYENNKRVVTLQKKIEPHFCPICNCIMHSRGIYTRTVNHPIMQDGKQLVLKIKQRRYRCTNEICNYTCNEDFNFVKPYRRSTDVTDLLIVSAFKDPNLTAAQIAKKYNVSDTHAINTFSRYVEMHQKPLTEAVCIDEVNVSIDSVCKYALILQDFISGEPIDMLPGRNNECIDLYFSKIPLEERKKVKYIISDIYRPYQHITTKFFPNAVPVIDSFHVVKAINYFLSKYIHDLIRKLKEKDIKQHQELEQELNQQINYTPSKEYYLLKKYSWIILKNNDEIVYTATPLYNTRLKQYVTLYDIENMIFEIDPNLKELRALKEKYIHFNKEYGNNYIDAKDKLNDIINDYNSCPFTTFHKIAELLSANYEPIVNSFIMVERHCKGNTYIKRLSNAPIEALNRIVKDMKRNGRGYRNFEHLRNRFLFSQRESLAILPTPKLLEEVIPSTGVHRGTYNKHK